MPPAFFATPAPVIKYVAPVPADEHVTPAPVVRFTAPAPAIENVTPEPGVTCATPVPVIEHVAPASVIEHIAPALPVTISSPSQQLLPAYTMDTTCLVNPRFSTAAAEEQLVAEETTQKTVEIRTQVQRKGEEWWCWRPPDHAHNVKAVAGRACGGRKHQGPQEA